MKGGRHYIICISCPQGCQAEVLDGGKRIESRSKLCKKGIAYIQEEFKDPKRILTTVVRVENSRSRLLPVRTSGPIPKRILMDCNILLSKIKVKPPIQIGEIIFPNILESGQDVVASDDLLT